MLSLLWALSLAGRPHVFMMLVDDWGSYDASYRMKDLGRTPGKQPKPFVNVTSTSYTESGGALLKRMLLLFFFFFGRVPDPTTYHQTSGHNKCTDINTPNIDKLGAEGIRMVRNDQHHDKVFLFLLTSIQCCVRIRPGVSLLNGRSFTKDTTHIYRDALTLVRQTTMCNLSVRQHGLG